jgi:uncharacterized membrane protein YoaK (UPF0700 family)
MKASQISESVPLGILLAVAGGLMDAYSYVCRGKVFANAQTGNILLLGVRLSEREWAAAGRYLCPILAFILGLAAADFVRSRMGQGSLLHWRQAALLAECAILCAVAFLPLEANLLANSLTSLACGIQVESFRKIGGNTAATTMCIGNLRSATQAVCEYSRTRDREALRRGVLYFCLIAFFVAGAILGNFAVKLWSTRAILWSAVFLFSAFSVLFLERREPAE